jgi:hypothetical protein
MTTDDLVIIHRVARRLRPLFDAAAEILDRRGDEAYANRRDQVLAERYAGVRARKQMAKVALPTPAEKVPIER